MTVTEAIDYILTLEKQFIPIEPGNPNTGFKKANIDIELAHQKADECILTILESTGTDLAVVSAFRKIRDGFWYS